MDSSWWDTSHPHQAVTQRQSSTPGCHPETITHTRQSPTLTQSATPGSHPQSLTQSSTPGSHPHSPNHPHQAVTHNLPHQRQSATAVTKWQSNTPGSLPIIHTSHPETIVHARQASHPETVIHTRQASHPGNHPHQMYPYQSPRDVIHTKHTHTSHPEISSTPLGQTLAQR